MTEELHLKRMIEEFQQLTAVDALSFEEYEISLLIKEKMQKLGFEISEDEAGEYYEKRGLAQKGKSAGNLYGYLKGTLEGEPLLFSAHMDTVRPGYGKKAIVRENRITSDGTTVLGADNMAGIVQIFEAVRQLQEEHIPHRDIEVLFPIAEEAYVKGSAVADYSRIRSKEAYVLDSSGPVGATVMEEPSLIQFTATMTGKAAHAGFAPETGINAIARCANAISRISQGRVDDHSVVNIGQICGGEATNIVSEKCVCKGELRSSDHAHALELLEDIRKTFEACKENAVLDFTYEIDLQAYHVDEQHPVMQRFARACEKMGMKPEIRTSFGGSDNNSFMRNGITGVVLSCGMQKIHTTEEFILLEDLTRGAALVKHLILEN